MLGIEMAEKKTPKFKKPRNAAERRTVVRARVASPHDQVLSSEDRVETWGVEKVERVIDTIDVMFRRKQLSERQKLAADTYSKAYDNQFAGLTGTLNPSKVGGSRAFGLPPPVVALEAAETIREASKILGRRDGDVVELIVGRGYSVEQCAAQVYGSDSTGRPDRDDKLTVGKRLRDSLNILADLWHLENKSARVRSWRPLVDTPVEIVEGEIMPAKVAHAGPRGKVDWSGR